MRFMKLIICCIVILISITMLMSGCTRESGSSTISKSVSTVPIQSSTTTSTTLTTLTTSQTTSASSTSQSTYTPKPKTYSSAPSMQIDRAKNYIASLETSLGTFKIKLLAQESPLTVNNFVFLSREGFYNGVIFHRIIKTFMIQTGDPTGTGSGTPGYKFADELPPKHLYDPGIVAMANSGSNTNGSQFFICTGPDAASLNNYPKYTQFGQIIEGMDIVQKIASVPVVSNGREVSKPVTPPFIKSVTIIE
jgi:cyclophilin family peptidyl-prolyl cis-trans isomerase